MYKHVMYKKIKIVKQMAVYEIHCRILHGHRHCIHGFFDTGKLADLHQDVLFCSNCLKRST